MGYEHMQGNMKLREAITSHLKTYRNVETNASSILITSGAQQALHLIIQCLLKPGDSVALYKKHRIKMVFLNPIFQNPTGTTMSYERRKKVLEISTQYGIAIVEDDPYSVTGYDNEPIRSLKSMDQDGSVLRLKRKRDITLHALQSAFKDNIEYGIPSGGIHLWCKLKEELNEQHLFKECVKNGIVFAPGSTLGSNDRYMRFTYSRVDDHMIEEGIRRFAEVIKPIE
ncbi:DNA-binding transcriptional MocR family regulator [Paenibacillus sp. V4I9]|uniref:aminotransferase-like domain-containing protein n=1 Tax=Paenibacillus sp. V4I9 TaxID=3042308 RepID=UPI00278A9386|nr:PLP-dependent aminotransferase family protein [Paenibacillus sp. V4I9]MDQ0889763.1 DNA-binding transcriptional MocR family regulator [Paenibacillus sp. V4I9]